MLKLDKIKKVYVTGDSSVEALKGVSIEFRENEFVSILGPSGCGKTTLLNIIGGLDKYTSGDLVIDGISTKKYRDSDWDTYRNHRIGFVFQSYNLIPHQTVLSNVELALTLSGVSKKERREKAIAALTRVGLKDQLSKKPNQMSGGQMQRVAIARALVNDPDILLADEPTGALDSETSTQVMDILSEVAKDRLVIMVTHNGELALSYSSRIIRLLDGNIMSDSMPLDNKEEVVNPCYDIEPTREGIGYWNSRSGSADPKITNEAFVSGTEETAEELSYDNQSDIPSKPFSPAEELFTMKAVYDEIPDYTEKDIKQLRSKRRKEEKLEKKHEKAEEKKENKANSRQSEPLQSNSRENKKTDKKTSMTFSTALSLSFNNLLTKKARTLLTAFAGSIGIIGIALILSLSNGVQLYIDKVEEDTLSSYPLSIQKQTVDITSFMATMQPDNTEKKEHEDGYIYTNCIMTGMMDTMLKEVATNNLSKFKKYIEENEDKFRELTSDIQYSYSTTMNIYRADIENGIFQVNPDQVYSSLGMGSSGMSSANVWTRLLDNDKLLSEQYEVLYGHMPEKYDEVVLMVSENNEITDYTLYSLGILDPDDMKETFGKLVMGEEATFIQPDPYTYEELAALKFKLLLNTDYFKKEGDIWVDNSENEVWILDKLSEATEISIVGIIRSSSDAAMSNMAGTIGYRTELMEYLISKINSSDIVREQKENPERDIFTGLKFSSDDENTDELTMEMLYGYLESLPEEERTQYTASIAQMKQYGMSDEKILEAFGSAMVAQKTDNTYEENLHRLGVSDLDSPSAINIYPKDFESKDYITDLIADYNASVPDEEKITYTDLVALIMSSVTTIINAISYILIAFVAISLVVSSIMIGIITYISVLERTKEIGILRSIGASKHDVSTVFNAETLIVGFTAGAMGILISELLLIPINAIIYKITDIEGIAVLPTEAAFILVAISMFLTLIAGLLPSRVAAKKDPVIALRSE